jgi:hypothetical protein
MIKKRAKKSQACACALLYTLQATECLFENKGANVAATCVLAIHFSFMNL